VIGAVVVVGVGHDFLVLLVFRLVVCCVFVVCCFEYLVTEVAGDVLVSFMQVRFWLW
jgi:hypothetical protein